jgi:hypothetical protein
MRRLDRQRSMQTQHSTPSSDDVIAEAGSLAAGLGILTMTYFPFGLPALVLALPLAIPLIPIALVALVLLLLARLLGLTLRLTRALFANATGAGRASDGGGGLARSVSPRPAPQPRRSR